MSETAGRLLLWIEPAGIAGWITARAPLGDRALVHGLGIARDSGPARLAWRIQLAHAGPGADTPVRFLMLDLLSLERVWRPGASLRPWGRLGLGVGVDLQGARRDLGSDGYFNADNGASAGLSLNPGLGLDAWLGERWFLRLEAGARALSGAGRNGLLLGATLGLGFAFALQPDPASAPPAGPPAPN